MKSSKQWVDELSQSGPFDLVESCKDAEYIVRQIQLDVVRDLELRMMQKINQVFGGVEFTCVNMNLIDELDSIALICSDEDIEWRIRQIIIHLQQKEQNGN